MFGKLIDPAPKTSQNDIAKLKGTNHTFQYKKFIKPNRIGRLVLNASDRIQLASKSKSESKRNIFVSVSSGSIPKGTSLNLNVKEEGYINGEYGEITNKINLAKTNQLLISDIGTCTSGNEKSGGFNLEYIFTVPASVKSVDNANELIVTLTMVETI